MYLCTFGIIEFKLVSVSFLNLFIVTRFAYFATHSEPVTWDEANHLKISLDVYHQIKKGDIHFSTLGDEYYPPLVHGITVLIYSVFGIQNARISILWTNTFITLLLIVSVFGLARIRECIGQPKNYQQWTLH